MLCRLIPVYCGLLIVAGIGFGLRQTARETRYGRYVVESGSQRLVPAKLAWLLQEMPSFLVPLLLYQSSEKVQGIGKDLLLGLFCGHYFQRTFIYSLLTKGRPFPLRILVSALSFCAVNGLVQGQYMLHCVVYEEAWLTDIRLVVGLILFFVGMAINIHSDYILRSLRRPGEVTYNVPKGGVFEYVSGANFFGEIVEWFGYAIATWSLPALSFALFTACSIGPRAYHHHRYYQRNFKDYPRSRKALIPFLF